MHASFTISDYTLKRAALLMGKFKTEIHIHVAEDKYDQEHCMMNHKQWVVERLDHYNLVNHPKSILAHCIHLRSTEKKIISNSAAWVAQNTESNLNNGVGNFNSNILGANILMGTDGMHNDMLRSLNGHILRAKTLILLHRKRPTDVSETYNTTSKAINLSIMQQTNL